MNILTIIGPSRRRGGASSFPQIVASSNYVEATEITDHPVALPSGIVSGERLLMLVRQGGTNVSKTPPTGWTLVISSGPMETYQRTADGSEASTATVTLASARKLVAVTMRIAPAVDVNAATVNLLDSPTLSPSWGSDDTLWLAASSVAQNDAVFEYTGDPTDYIRLAYLETTDGAGAGDTTDAQLVVAYRELAAATEDPSAWPTSGPQTLNRSQTIAVQP
jgi:hypothetical protein